LAERRRAAQKNAVLPPPALLGLTNGEKAGEYPCFPPSITGNSRKSDSAMKYPG
jgi:hypothetical protein